MTITAGAGTYLQTSLLNVLGGATFPAVPAHWYLALFTTAPTNGAAGTEVTATAAPTYARLAITPDTTHFPAATSASGVSTVANGVNTILAAMGNSTGIAIVGWGLYDAATGGNMWFYGPTTSTTLAATDTAEFVTGNLTFTAQ
jgi:hypothetical protein